MKIPQIRSDEEIQIDKLLSRIKNLNNEKIELIKINSELVSRNSFLETLFLSLGIDKKTIDEMQEIVESESKDSEQSMPDGVTSTTIDAHHTSFDEKKD